MGLSWPIPPEIPEFEYLGIFPRLLSPAYPKLPIPPPIPLVYLYEPKAGIPGPVFPVVPLWLLA